MKEALLILGMALVTFAIRYGVLALVGRFDLPEQVQRGLRYVPPAVLSAIIAPALLMPEGRLQIGPGNAHLIAGVVATLVAWRTKSLTLTILVGMGVFLGWRLVVG